ncbi:MAG: O-antigen ligase family protein [Candidatus Thiodiazotropha taylori]|nr:O-antigen ligase family protein [Candidatus Thiodiazotropha taylori]MCG7908583.1 O-antigen ligase family protein [Candidatus Thiodiazotropha taylori]MCG7996288.1 O-antigen ligase family protein [Candidatus Thiodiazotropha taylori]
MLQALSPYFKPSRIADSKLQQTSDWIGVLGLYIFSFFSLLSIAGANLGLGLMLIGLLLSSDAWRRLPRQFLFWSCLLIIAYIVYRGVEAMAEIPLDHKTQANQARDWALLFLFFIPAWWLSQSPRRIPTALGLMLAGFTLGILSALDGETLAQLLQGERSGMHFGKPIIFGFDCAAAILGLIVLAIYRLNPQLKQNRSQQVLLVVLIILGILFYTQGLIISQSRGVWLALFFALPTIFLTLKFTRQSKKQPKVSLLMPLAAVGLVLALILALNWDTIQSRVSTEQTELGTVVSEGLDEAPLTSSTYRLHLWEFGLNKWLERPFTGWGPGTTHALVEAENNPNLKDHRDVGFDHLHNAYLEVVFQLGLVGIMIIALICGLMVSKIMEAFRRQRISIYFLAFLFSNFMLIAIYSLTDFRHLHWNWRFYWLIIAGCAYAFTLMTFRPHLERQNRTPQEA